MAGKILKLSLKAIINNKMRSFLTMLGIIISVMAVVILVSFTQGAMTGITPAADQCTAHNIRFRAPLKTHSPLIAPYIQPSYCPKSPRNTSVLLREFWAICQLNLRHTKNTLGF